MKNHLFCGARSSINIWFFKQLAQYTQHPFKNTVRYILKYQWWRINMHHCFVGGFGLVQTPKLYYLFVEISFLLHLGTHRSNTGKVLENCHLYHEEASFYLDVRPQLFNRAFIIFFVYDHNNIWRCNIHYFFYLYNILLTDKKSSELLV